MAKRKLDSEIPSNETKEKKQKTVKEIVADGMIGKCMKIYDIVRWRAECSNDMPAMPSNTVDFVMIDGWKNETKLTCQFELQRTQWLKPYMTTCLKHFGFTAEKEDDNNDTNQVVKYVGTPKQLVMYDGKSLNLSINPKLRSEIMTAEEIYKNIRLCYGLGRCVNDAYLKLNTLLQIVRRVNNKASSKCPKVPKVVMVMIMEYMGPY